MSYQPHLWQRFEEEGIPIYLRGDLPVWFVPNQAGDRVLRDLTEGRSVCDEPAVSRFLERLPDSPALFYPGRSALIQADHLRELWFHITNRCDLSCRHCMFASGPCDAEELPPKKILQLAEEASRLGCRVFSLTGGEPLVHEEFETIVNGLLAFPDAQVVILTNGMQLSRVFAMGRWDFERLHLQVSVDGMGANHDQIRGPGTFDVLSHELLWLKKRGIPFTVSMCVTRSNLEDMPALVDFAADTGAGNVHFMWYFVRGRGGEKNFADPQQIFQSLVQANERALQRGLVIDNLELLKSQIFTPGGTIHDGSSSGWESAAVGPDGKLYPSAALVGVSELATVLEEGLAEAWRDSAVLKRIRNATAAELDSPWRFILGGGDLDHSYIGCRRYIGGDPYLPLYEQLARWQISREAIKQDEGGPPRLRLKMGDILESCGAHGAVALVHSNCLLSVARADSHSAVRDFYREAAEEVREDILNPVCYAEEVISHIPQSFRFRGYGCGSPVLDAELKAGERVVDLGSGRGIECFIAARQVGPAGRVTGIDMLDNMLELSRQGAEAVTRQLGFDNLVFCQGYLESLPLEDGSTDVVLSNCVMNLSSHKRKAFKEIFRILDEGGRLVMSDVVCDDEPDAAIRNDELLRGECIAGALSQKDLVGILEETGFIGVRLIKRFPYRVVRGHPFFSLTFEAHKPCSTAKTRVIYRGPMASIISSSGQLLIPGMVHELGRQEAELLGEALFILDDDGAVTNLAQGVVGCCTPPEAITQYSMADSAARRFSSGCMVCGSALRYLSVDEKMECSYCQKTLTGSVTCEEGHFVCDSCHSADALQVIEDLCLDSRETDLLILFDRIRRHSSVPLHGPEYHALVPGVILATYRNLGGEISPELILAGIRRGSRVAGGSCAFWGVCGAAAGVGIAFSLLLEANPLRGEFRQAVQRATQQVLADIAAISSAARCCQRDCRIALRKAAELSLDLLPLSLQGAEPPPCGQRHLNRECSVKSCPWSDSKIL